MSRNRSAGCSSDWQSEATTWENRVQKVLATEKLTDVTFRFTDEDNTVTTLKAHSLLLSMYSAVFEAMFYGDLPPEKDENGFKVDIEDIDACTFDLILKSFYTTSDHNLEPENLKMAIKLHIAADKYMFIQLKDYLRSMIVKKINQDNCLTALDYGVMIDDEESIKEAKSTIELHSQEALSQLFTESLPVTRQQTLNFLFFQCKLNTREVIIFKALFLWAKAIIDCQDGCVKDFVESVLPKANLTVRKFLDGLGLLKAIDFKEMSKAELTYDVFSTGMFTADEIKSISESHLPDYLMYICTARRRESNINIKINPTRVERHESDRIVGIIFITVGADVWLTGFSCYDFSFSCNIDTKEEYTTLYWNKNKEYTSVFRDFYLEESRRMRANEEYMFLFTSDKGMQMGQITVGELNYCGMQKTAGGCSLALKCRGDWPDDGNGLTLRFLDS